MSVLRQRATTQAEASRGVTDPSVCRAAGCRWLSVWQTEVSYDYLLVSLVFIPKKCLTHHMVEP